jgi:hypothetical protein
MAHRSRKHDLHDVEQANESTLEPVAHVSDNAMVAF